MTSTNGYKAGQSWNHRLRLTRNWLIAASVWVVFLFSLVMLVQSLVHLVWAAEAPNRWRHGHPSPFLRGG